MEGESSVVKRYFEGLENDSQSLSKLPTKLRGLKNDVPLFTVSAWPTVTANSWYCRRTAGYLHHHCYRRITAVIFSNWWRTSSASDLTGRSICPNRLFVIIGHGRTTSSKVTILACVWEFKLVPPWLVKLLNTPTECHRRQNGKPCSAWNAALEYVDQRRRVFRITSASRHASRAMTPEHTQFLRTISHRLGIYSVGFLAVEVSDNDDNDGVNVDEQQQQHSGPATCATAAADATSARSATCEVCLLVYHFPVRYLQVVHFQSPHTNDSATL